MLTTISRKVKDPKDFSLEPFYNNDLRTSMVSRTQTFYRWAWIATAFRMSTFHHRKSKNLTVKHYPRFLQITQYLFFHKNFFSFDGGSWLDTYTQLTAIQPLIMELEEGFEPPTCWFFTTSLSHCSLDFLFTILQVRRVKSLHLPRYFYPASSGLPWWRFPRLSGVRY